VMLRGWLGLQEMLKASRKLQNCGKNKILREQSQNALAEGTAPTAQLPAADTSPGRKAEKRKAKPPPPPPTSTSRGFGSLWVLWAVSEPTQALPSPNFPTFFPSFHLPQSLRSPWSPCHRSPETGVPIASAVSKELGSLCRLPHCFLTPPRRDPLGRRWL